MDRRLLLAVAISIGILILWWKFFPAAQPPPPPAPSPAPTTEAARPAYDGGTPAIGTPAPAQGGAAALPATPQPVVRPAEVLVTLESSAANYVFSTWGAVLRQIKLKDRQFLLDRSRPDSGMQIVSTSGEETAPLRTTFSKPNFAWHDAMAWSVDRAAGNTVVFRAETDEVLVEKRFTLEPHRYRLTMTVAVANKSSRPLDHGLVVHLYAAQDPDEEGRRLLGLRLGESGRDGVSGQRQGTTVDGGGAGQGATEPHWRCALGGGWRQVLHHRRGAHARNPAARARLQAAGAR